MDEGWSWVIMVMAFSVHMSYGGLNYTVGFIRYIMLQNADQTEARYITWITSIYSGMMSVVAPIASLFVYKYGCRASVIVGATFETLGFIISYLAMDKWVYFISYSFISALGAGLTYVAVLVLLNFNFERYLPIASGMACSGQGIGVIFIPIIMNSLFEMYGLQGMFLLLGGITLQKWIFGALMRPSVVELDQISKFGKSQTIKNQKCPENLPKSTEFANQKSLGIDKENVHIQEDFGAICISDILPDQHKDEVKEENVQFPSIFSADLEIKAEAKDGSAHVISGEVNIAFVSDEGENVIKEIKDGVKMASIGRETDINAPSFTADKIVKQSLSKIQDDEQKGDDLSDFVDDILHKNEANENKMVAENNVPSKMVDSLASNTEKAYPDQASCPGGTNHNPYLKVLKIRKFRFFLCSILFYSFPEHIVFMMFPNYFVDNGSSLSEVSYLLSIFGISSTITRVLMGILANSEIVDIYVLFSVPFGILGVATLLLPFYVYAFTGRVFYVILFGLYDCSVYSLLNKIILRITGIDNLSAAFGFVVLINGTAGICGSPLAGCMYLLCLLSMVLLTDKAETFVNNDDK